MEGWHEAREKEFEEWWTIFGTGFEPGMKRPFYQAFLQGFFKGSELGAALFGKPAPMIACSECPVAQQFLATKLEAATDRPL